MPESPPTQYIVEAENVKIQTSDYKTFVCTIICRVCCPTDKIDYDQTQKAITMALETVGSNMTYDEIANGMKELIEGAMRWDKLPELLGEGVWMRIMLESVNFQ